jgi:hypothetical protein
VSEVPQLPCTDHQMVCLSSARLSPDDHTDQHQHALNAASMGGL